MMDEVVWFIGVTTVLMLLNAGWEAAKASGFKPTLSSEGMLWFSTCTYLAYGAWGLSLLARLD